MDKVKIEVLDYDYTDGCKFYSSYESTHTFIVKVAPDNPFEIFCHQSQTDQLILVDGECHFIWIENNKLKCYTMHEYSPAVVTVPPNVWHGSINTSRKPCTMVNAMIKHAEPADGDYTPKRELSEEHQQQLDQLMNIINY